MSKIVIALGGNALGNNPKEQIEMIEKAAKPLVGLIKDGHEIIVSHGNGPQVGTIKLAFDTASAVNDKVCEMELAECTAMSQGYIGYHLQQGIKKELLNQQVDRNVATIVTQVIVDKDDKAFSNPTKPIGSFYTKEKADEIKKSNPDLTFVEDSGRGYRTVVASPRPIDIAEKTAVLDLTANKFIVIACGGGGIPVIKNDAGTLEGVSAVIDKDFAAEKLAELVSADYLFILTAVDRVAVNFGKPEQKDLAEMTVEEAKKYCEEGHFAPGSMLPKVEAAMMFVESGSNRKAVICSLEKVQLAVKGESGTLITQ
ncbi:Carbamate kinase 1 [Sebaldella termitidis]|uniref:Carbamate kinase n=1 Tax=Sebaldella termitidis (strain ATCC 33386 / NCTC 11300) TaxID=526218 RepID=D1AQM3_SEBTE|nr:carbamate kinase [Sebaldella termitidis]ACZ10283.1 carbamate kinase [Sebaldella termitidis ATCC 33386]SUI25622.1 Carbamate kinase 1 [Sebaldella termitidis]